MQQGLVSTKTPRRATNMWLAAMRARGFDQKPSTAVGRTGQPFVRPGQVLVEKKRNQTKDKK